MAHAFKPTTKRAGGHSEIIYKEKVIYRSYEGWHGSPEALEAVAGDPRLWWVPLVGGRQRDMPCRESLGMEFIKWVLGMV